ncbi:MAG: hypothetical protein KDE31_35770, partial [Caldilineaceae bacterium]|nr:hypothetical protein [Caldilineaceae bacterium]
GTTTDFRDNWTIGYTRYLVTGVWAGNSDGHPMRNTSGVTGAAPIWHDFMERILADPTLWTTLGAPANEESWRFVPPATVQQLAACPPTLNCRQDGEYFRTSWLEATASAGPLADSVERVKSAPVYVREGEAGRLVGFCSVDEAAERTVLRMPDDVGLALLKPAIQSPLTAGFQTSASLATTDVDNRAAIVATTSITQTVSSLDKGQLQTIGWALRNHSVLNFGPCERLAEIVPAALALQSGAGESNLRVLVDLAAAGNPDVAALVGDGSVDLAALSQAVNVETGLVGGGAYAVSAPVIHDNNCPGQYIMGRIVNHAGAPVSGVWVKLRDQWGNEATAVSKNGAIDYGLFDFPIPSGSPHELCLTVLGEGGVAVSATVTIPHRQGEAADFSCHHIVFQGGV